jgi:uncharacterized membrane protein
MKNKLQSRGLNIIQKLDECLKNVISVIEYTTCKRSLDLAEKPEVGWCQIGTVSPRRNSSERILVNNCFDTFEE